MSLLAFVKFVFTCFEALAWPLFALGYPLRSSIQAIEANSDSDTKKLVTYWVIFSLISLFEHAFTGLLQWLPFWLYVKLTIVWWMMIPNFDGAFYVYNHFVHPCLYMDVQTTINWIKKQQELIFFKDHFLAEADNLVEVHEPEAKALEKLTATETKSILQKDMKPVQVAEKKEVAPVNLIPETEANATRTVNSLFTPPVIKEVAGSVPPEIPSDKQVQKEWTCALCQVTTQSEITLNSHLVGRRHRETYEELMRATNQPSKAKVSSASVDRVKHYDFPRKERRKQDSGTSTQASQQKQQRSKSQPKQSLPFRCNICNISCGRSEDLNSHLWGKKHLAQIQELNNSLLQQGQLA